MRKGDGPLLGQGAGDRPHPGHPLPVGGPQRPGGGGGTQLLYAQLPGRGAAAGEEAGAGERLPGADVHRPGLPAAPGRPGPSRPRPVLWLRLPGLGFFQVDRVRGLFPCPASGQRPGVGGGRGHRRGLRCPARERIPGHLLSPQRHGPRLHQPAGPPRALLLRPSGGGGGGLLSGHRQGQAAAGGLPLRRLHRGALRSGGRRKGLSGPRGGGDGPGAALRGDGGGAVPAPEPVLPGPAGNPAPLFRPGGPGAGRIRGQALPPGRGPAAVRLSPGPPPGPGAERGGGPRRPGGVSLRRYGGRGEADRGQGPIRRLSAAVGQRGGGEAVHHRRRGRHGPRRGVLLPL